MSMMSSAALLLSTALSAISIVLSSLPSGRSAPSYLCVRVLNDGVQGIELAIDYL
jgi:hypothetical protein